MTVVRAVAQVLAIATDIMDGEKVLETMQKGLVQRTRPTEIE